MLCTQIISPDYPTLSTKETVADLQELFQKSGETLIPLLNDQLLEGLLCYEDIQSIDPKTTLEKVPARTLFVGGKEHFLSALKTMSLTGMAILPVINEDRLYEGVITRISLLQALGTIMDINSSTGAIIVLQMAKTAFSFTELARLIESNDANITQLNSYLDVSTNQFIVTIRLDRMEVSDIISTLQRYEYKVVYFWGNELYENELRQNYDALMNYLSI